MNLIRLSRPEAVALLDRLNAAAQREQQPDAFIDAAAALSDAIAQKTLLGTYHMTVEAMLTDSETSAAMHAAITYGTGREIQ